MRFQHGTKRLSKNLRNSIKNTISNLKDSYRLNKGNSKNLPPVFVYQMGKVASSSIYFSLKQHYSGLCAHAHLYSKDHKTFGVRLMYKHYSSKGGKLKVISPIRPPIERNFSEFFSSIEVYTKRKYLPKKFSQEDLKKLYLLYYPHFVSLEWFDENIKKHFDIDVFEYSFPDDGHLVISNKKVDILILKYDIEDKKKEEIIRKFVKCPEFKLENRNIGSTKNYGEDYARFIETITLPAFLIEMIKNSKYYNHFYSKEEIAKSVQKYSADLKVS